MPIQLINRPSDQNWSGNPIHYHLYSAAAAADASIAFEVKIFFKRSDAVGYSEIVVLKYDPVGGSARLDIQDVLDGLMEYETPTIAPDFEYNSPTFAKKMTGLFYIGWREITAADPDPAWDTTESAYAKFVIKGGIAFHKWRGDNFWVNYFFPVKPFLTWQLSGRLARYNERMYLAWLNLTDVDAGAIKMRRKVVFTDGTNYTADLNCPATKNDVVFFPSGARQLKLQEINPVKRIYYWELQVWNSADGVPLSDVFRYELDNKNNYNDINLNYRNSLGAFDSVSINGVVEFSLTREFTEQGQIVMYNYFTGGSIKGKVKAANSTELQIYKGDIGHLKKEEQQRLRDIHFQREVWWEQQGKWLPVLAMTGSQKLASSTDQVRSMPIEFAIASGGDRYFTPDSVNLAEGNLPSIVGCTAVISTPESEATGGGYQITWALQSGAPVKYMISTAGVSGGAPHESVIESYFFSWLPPGDNVIKVQPICLIAGELVAGTPKYVTVTVAATCTPVTIDDDIELPDAIEGIDYDFTIALSGTPPFALSNVIKPGWMTLLIDGSELLMGGTPGGLDAGTNPTISFTISNCDGAFVDFEDTIHVHQTSQLIIENHSEDLSIEDVTPAFYVIDAGTFPVAPDLVVIALHQGTSGTLSVVVSGSADYPRQLKLYRNNILQNTIDVPAAGTYNLITATFASSVELKIILE